VQGDGGLPVNIDRYGPRLAALVAGMLLALPWYGLGLILQSIKLVLASALLTYAFMPAVIWLAHRIGALDRPGARRVHQQPTPRIGGLAVFISVNISLLFNFNYSVELKAICISGALVAALSMWDDVKGLSASWKLLGQLVAMLILFQSGMLLEFNQEERLVSLLGSSWGIGIDMFLEYLITALWIIGIANAFNFLDGINGLAAALAAAVCLLMGLLAASTAQLYMLLLCLAVAGSSLGFLPDNARYVRTARAFLGDTGSIYLGWMMAGIAVMGEWSDASSLNAYAAPLLIFSVMIFDMIYTTVARIHRGDVTSVRTWVSYVGRDHLHHRLMYLGLTQKQTVVAVVGIALCSGLAALAMIHAGPLTVTLLLGQSVVLYLLLSALMVLAAKRLEEGE